MTRATNNGKQALSARIQQKLHFRQRIKHFENNIDTEPQVCFKKRFQTAEYLANLMQKLDRIMLLQMTFIELGEHIIRSRRLQLLVIFLHAGMSVVYNSYYLVLYLLRYALRHEEYILPLKFSFLHYGSYIVESVTIVTLTVYSFSLVYDSLQQTIRIMNKFHIIARDEKLKTRLSQYAANLNSSMQKYTIFGLYNVDGSLVAAMISGTITYIIILIQYGGTEGDIVYPLPSQLNKTVAN